MQGQRSALDSFPEAVDLNQESLSNNARMDHSTSWNDMLNPVDNRNPHNARSFSGWDFGESSSSANLRDHIPGDCSKMENGWPSIYSTAAAETRSEECRFERFEQFEPSNINLQDRVGNGLGGNQVALGPMNMRSSGSDCFPVTIGLTRYAGNDGDGTRSVFPNFCRSGRSGSEQDLSAGLPFDEGGTSAGNSAFYAENDDGSGSSMGGWGSSCKRKALEGTSAQPYPPGNTSVYPQAESFVPGPIPARHNASSEAVNPPAVGRSEQQLNSRFGVGMGGVTSDVFPPPSVTGSAENSTNSGGRINLGRLEPVPFNIPSAGNSVRRSNARASHQSSRAVSFNECSEFGLTASLSSNPSNPSNQSHLLHGTGLSRNMPFTWTGTLNSNTGSSSSSLTPPVERGVGLHEEPNFSTIRNTAEHPMLVPVTETRNSVQEPTHWSLATGSSNNPVGGVASSSRAGRSSGSRPYASSWLPHQNSQSQNQLTLSDFAPWALFPSIESDSGAPRGHLSPFASGHSPSPEETEMPSGSISRGRRHSYSRSALLLEDDVNGWRSLAADINGRQRLVSEIRHVLNAMRRGENLRAEDYMLFDPFIYGVGDGIVEFGDRHRDMRLDVDNMSYEELLALEERIGDVNTGLSEETILKSLKQWKFLSFMIGTPSKIEPCCICQEEYASGETIGTLDCGHEFHANCVKQWLLQKNLCPICKMTALGT